MSSRRDCLRGGLAAVAALLAGCGSSDTAPDDSAGSADLTTDPTVDTTRPPSDEPTAAPTTQPTPPPTADDDATPTEIGRTTAREPVGTGRNPADVVLSNGSDRPREVSVTVRREGATEPHYDRTATLGPGGRYRMDVFGTDASGTHVARFRLADGTERAYEWDLNEQSEDGWLWAGVTDAGGFAVTYAVA